MNRRGFEISPMAGRVEGLKEYLNRELPRLADAVTFDPDLAEIREISATVTGILVLTDTLGGLVLMNHTAGNAAVISLHATFPWPPGCHIDVVQYGAGASAISASAGVTIRTPTTQNFAAQYSRVRCTNIALNEWLLSGGLA